MHYTTTRFSRYALPRHIALALVASTLLFHSANIAANATTTEQSVGETFKHTGEYINPNGDGYPTSTKVEYVMGCLSANGMELENLHKCSCSIDFIASKLPYDKYVQADTVLRAQLDIGTKGAVFRESSWAKDIVSELQEIQAASSLECF